MYPTTQMVPVQYLSAKAHGSLSTKVKDAGFLAFAVELLASERDKRSVKDINVALKVGTSLAFEN